MIAVKPSNTCVIAGVRLGRPPLSHGPHGGRRSTDRLWPRGRPAVPPRIYRAGGDRPRSQQPARDGALRGRCGAPDRHDGRPSAGSVRVRSSLVGASSTRQDKTRYVTTLVVLLLPKIRVLFVACPVRLASKPDKLQLGTRPLEHRHQQLFFRATHLADHPPAAGSSTGSLVVLQKQAKV